MVNNTNRAYITLTLVTILLILLAYSEITGYASLTEGRNLIISLDIPPDQQKINPGEAILLEVDIRELGVVKEEISIIEIEYAIKDTNGNIISSKKETGSVTVKQSEVTSLLIPTTTKSGVYEASATVLYKNQYYTATKIFEVISEYNVKNLDISVLIVLIILVLIIIIILILSFKRKQPLPPAPDRKIRKTRKKRRH